MKTFHEWLNESLSKVEYEQKFDDGRYRWLTRYTGWVASLGRGAKSKVAIVGNEESSVTTDRYGQSVMGANVMGWDRDRPVRMFDVWAKDDKEAVELIGQQIDPHDKRRVMPKDWIRKCRVIKKQDPAPQRDIGSKQEVPEDSAEWIWAPASEYAIGSLVSFKEPYRGRTTGRIVQKLGPHHYEVSITGLTPPDNTADFHVREFE